MIEHDKENDVFSITCDECPDSEEFDSGLEFMDVLKLAKDTGWKIVQSAGRWNHICPACSKQEL